MPEFIGWCRSSDPRDIRACETYVCGVVDAMAVESSINSAGTRPFCLPEGILCAELSRTVVSKLEQRPYYLHTIIADAIRYELKQSFPCP
ncbi:MAG: Rap1a/Tai family immunity protein [Alphaproteobacteria bacterium]